jgi:hypothetical protein
MYIKKTKKQGESKTDWERVKAIRRVIRFPTIRKMDRLRKRQLVFEQRRA